MSGVAKLSPALKALIDAPFARASTTPAPKSIGKLYETIGQEATAKKLAPTTWLSLTTATTMTLNSPESLSILHATASANKPQATAVANAEFMREVGLKCIGFNGVPRTINCLNAFHSSLPETITSSLTTRPSRQPTPESISASSARGRALWTSIYRGFDAKLVAKLAQSHPDLPVHIINSEYGLLFADPPRAPVPGQNVGRVATSVVAVAALRAQTGVGPQVISHLFGLRKALADGTWESDVETKEGAEWLAGDEGGVWLLESVDRIVREIGKGEGTTFAKAKL